LSCPDTVTLSIAYIKERGSGQGRSNIISNTLELYRHHQLTVVIPKVILSCTLAYFDY
jgi:hypothetical protein